jgi:NAD(P)-dependent dehydrogenase (short-subunit alcohol dehydrogenase family)
MDRFGRLDVLVNNAHVGIINRSIEELTDEDVDTSLAGLRGTLYFMQCAIPVMKAQGAGKIINFVSRRGLQCMAGAGAYAASKEGIRALSRVAARELGAFNIQVNCVSPAATSPAAEKFAMENPDRAKAIRAEMALGRLGDPERDIGRVALFLATEMSDYVTGQTISADGGIVML